MKERPILFSGPMVRAILDGRKTQTRRIIKLPHNNPLGEWEPTKFGGPEGGRTAAGDIVPEQDAIWHTRTGECLISSQGQPGDRLWVRETWNWEKNAIGAVHDKDGPFAYAASPMCGSSIDGKWRPSIHMPRFASRITLQITRVRVERLQDISDADAIAEGIERDGEDWKSYRGGSDVGFPAVSYSSLWTSMYGPHAWDANPWVWAIDFKHVGSSAA